MTNVHRSWNGDCSQFGEQLIALPVERIEGGAGRSAVGGTDGGRSAAGGTDGGRSAACGTREERCRWN